MTTRNGPTCPLCGGSVVDGRCTAPNHPRDSGRQPLDDATRRRIAAEAQRIIERQIEPQLAAQEARARGVDVDIAFVSTAADAPGHDVACHGCGRRARLPFKPPAGKGVLCPTCIAEVRAGR